MEIWPNSSTSSSEHWQTRRGRAILARLAQGDLTVGELAAPFSMSQPAISRHLKVLEGAGLISRTRRATARLSHLEGEPLREASDWLACYRAFWEERYERLDELLETLKASTPGDSPAQTKEGRVP